MASGIFLDVRETGQGGYSLTRITKDGKPIADEARFIVTCLATPTHMEPLLEWGLELNDLGKVRSTWVEAVEQGSVTLEAPEDYITVRSCNG